MLKREPSRGRLKNRRFVGGSARKKMPNKLPRGKQTRIIQIGWDSVGIQWRTKIISSRNSQILIKIKCETFRCGGLGVAFKELPHCTRSVAGGLPTRRMKQSTRCQNDERSNFHKRNRFATFGTFDRFLDCKRNCHTVEKPAKNALFKNPIIKKNYQWQYPNPNCSPTFPQ